MVTKAVVIRRGNSRKVVAKTLNSVKQASLFRAVDILKAIDNEKLLIYNSETQAKKVYGYS